MPNIEVSGAKPANSPGTSIADPRSVLVAVAVILNGEQEVLLTRRHATSHQGGLWEFPGGKVESEESLAEGLARELREELGISVHSHHPLIRVEHDYGDKRVVLDVHCVTAFANEPTPCEGQPMRWVSISKLEDYEFPAANRPIVEALMHGKR